jgi:hypothetical protein
VVGDAYDELMRSPTNVAVTTSQYLLREMLNEGGFTDAKLLAFSDSHRDMKDLDRAFTDPEVGTVLDQAALLGIELCLNDDANMEVSVEELGDLQPGSIVAESEREEAGWVTLEKAIDSAYELLLLLEDELGGDDVRESMGISLAETVAGTSYIRNHEDLLKSRLHRRLVRHVGERPYQGSVSLETDGLVDVRLTPETQVTSAENTVLRELVQEGNGAQIDDLDGATRDIVDTLVMNGVLDYQGDDRVSLNQTAVEVTLPSFGDIRYDPESDNYHSNLRSQFEEEQITITCGDSLTEKAEVSSPRFSERAFTVTRSRIGILLSRVYFGGTPKMERRETEHLFREGSYPNFLSSGPTMEMGVDIGSLDTLLLYGTPPNMNAYLQRIGRAGRSSGSSLVHSVSQRNPIDYYYYEEPTELITAEKQPVPLNEHNERVLRISLAWSVLDYVASEFTIPWESSRSKISGGENISRRTETSEEVREEAAKFTKLLASTVGALKLGSEESRLRSLGWIIEDNASEIKDHLNGILDYAYCSRCHRRYEQSSAGQTCHDVDCSGMLTSALEEHGELIDDAVQTASDIFVNGYRNYADRLRERIDQYESRKKECLSEQQTATGEQASRFKNEIQQISNRIEVIEQRLQDLSDESFHTVLDDAFSEYAFNLRTASDSVGIEVVDESGEPEHIGDDQSGRAARLAIAEFHPQASYLHRRRSYAVEQVFVDEKGSTDLRETVENHTHEDDELSYLSSEFVCSNCRSTTQDPETRCECATTDWKERKLFSIESVEATLESEQLPNKVDTAQAMYQRSESVQGTYANRETEILDFTPNRRFVMKTEEGMRIGSLAFGNYEILEYTQAYRAKYKSGAVDDEWNDFELCTEPDCTGVIYSDDSDTRRCSVNSDHVVDSGNAESVAARLGYAFSTEGIRVQFEDDTSGTAHALAHGVRLALQKLAGVTIRDVNEYIGSGHADVYDSLEGGAAVSRLLVEKNDGEYQNFHSAISMIQKQFDCDCSDGCPRCLFQYGCVRRNRPRTLNKDRLIEYLKNGVVLEERR